MSERHSFFIAPGAEVRGDVRLGDQASIWFSAVVSGVDDFVEVGDQANIQDNCVVEARPGRPARIGPRVTLGHNARVIGATVGEGAMIAIGATVLAGAHIGAGSIVAANATVPEGMHVPPGTLVIGQGRLLREVTPAETDRIQRGADGYVRLMREYSSARD
jgi:carbonic anhydrase/acetyltransferase-like protein (isoleucine patch superfamily)